MSQSPSQFDVSSLSGAQQCDCWRHHSSSRFCVRSVACLGFCRFHQCKKPGSRSIWSLFLSFFLHILCYKTVTWPLLRYCKNILCLLALIFHELGFGNKGNWESTKIKSKLTWNQLWPVTYYNQRYAVTTFFRSPSSISNVGQSFILSHTGRYNR